MTDKHSWSLDATHQLTQHLLLQLQLGPQFKSGQKTGHRTPPCNVYPTTDMQRLPIGNHINHINQIVTDISILREHACAKMCLPVDSHHALQQDGTAASCLFTPLHQSISSRSQPPGKVAPPLPRTHQSTSGAPNLPCFADLLATSLSVNTQAGTMAPLHCWQCCPWSLLKSHPTESQLRGYSAAWHDQGHQLPGRSLKERYTALRHKAMQSFCKCDQHDLIPKWYTHITVPADFQSV